MTGEEDLESAKRKWSDGSRRGGSEEVAVGRLVGWSRARGGEFNRGEAGI